MSFMDISIVTECLICGEEIPVCSRYEHDSPKICDDCKEAIITLKQRLEEENNNV